MIWMSSNSFLLITTYRYQKHDMLLKESKQNLPEANFINTNSPFPQIIRRNSSQWFLTPSNLGKDNLSRKQVSGKDERFQIFVRYMTYSPLEYSRKPRFCLHLLTDRQTSKLLSALPSLLLFSSWVCFSPGTPPLYNNPYLCHTHIHTEIPGPNEVRTDEGSNGIRSDRRREAWRGG